MTSEVEVAKTTPPIHYSNIIRQNDLNDVYDENALLKKVPKPFKKKALLLLKIFDERPDIQLLNGRYGAYLKIGKDNFKLPKDTTPENLSIEECIHISKNQAPKTAKKKVFRKK